MLYEFAAEFQDKMFTNNELGLARYNGLPEDCLYSMPNVNKVMQYSKQFRAKQHTEAKNMVRSRSPPH